MKISKSLIAVAAAVVVAVGTFFATGIPVGDAIAIALDSEKAKTACIELLTAPASDSATGEPAPVVVTPAEVSPAPAQ